MAYFANGSEGGILDAQCDECIFGEKPCPIAFVHAMYNYDQVGNKLAEKIMNDLVRKDGVCVMFDEFRDVLQCKE